MPIFGIIAAIGLALSAVGTTVAVKGSLDAADASEKAEELRKKQMDLDAMRRRREIVRKNIIARAQALSTATAQGAGETGSSALPGGYGQISGESGRASLAVSQNQEIGQGIFNANADASQAEGTASIGGGIFSIGNTMYGGSDKLGRLFG